MAVIFAELHVARDLHQGDVAHQTGEPRGIAESEARLAGDEGKLSGVPILRIGVGGGGSPLVTHPCGASVGCDLKGRDGSCHGVEVLSFLGLCLEASSEGT